MLHVLWAQISSTCKIISQIFSLCRSTKFSVTLLVSLRRFYFLEKERISINYDNEMLGLGALLIRKESYEALSKRYFGGGTVQMWLPQRLVQIYKSDISER